jgi:hypothetical protein
VRLREESGARIQEPGGAEFWRTEAAGSHFWFKLVRVQ